MKDNIIAIAKATLGLAVEIRQQLRLPEKFKAERELQTIIEHEDFVASAARGMMGKGSAEDIENAKRALGMVKK